MRIPKFSQREAKERLMADSARVSQGDLSRVIAHADDIKAKFLAKGPLGRFIKDSRLMLALVKDYRSGAYRQVPWYLLSAMVAALLYVLNPADLIPDFVPVFGYLDDAFMVGMCLLLVEQQLAEYETWRLAREEDADFGL